MSRPMPRAPEVSVVVIVYNDAELLPKAVASVLTQTLSALEVIIVDDASTDGSGEVADQLAATDARVRVMHLPENSGGCSAPRNAGLETAVAPYVMFLDSDDTYERHACKNLLLEAERSNADVVAGKCVRVYVDLGEERVWARNLFERRATYRNIRDNPELFFDTISTNKIYRRAFLNQHHIRFPDGVHYEDLLFVAKVYCLAQTISIIPNLVYIWRVLRSPEAAHSPKTLSISSRRFEIDNFRDRITVHRLIDEWLVENGLADLKVPKDVKFVRHDLRLYLSDLPARDGEYQRRFVDLAADYLAGVSDEALQLVDPIQRICVHLIRKRDVEETLKAVRWIKQGFKLATDLVERDGRIYWSAKYLDTDDDRVISDVTLMGLHRLPFPEQSVFNEVTAFSVRGSTISLTGSLINQLGQIAPGDPLRLTLTVRRRNSERVVRFQVADVQHAGRRITYSADIDVAHALAGTRSAKRVWDVAVEISWQDSVNRAPLSVEPELVDNTRIVVPGPLGSRRALLHPYVTTNGNLALRERAVPGRRQQAVKAMTLPRRVPSSLRRRARKVVNNKRLKAKAYPFLARLPMQRGLTVFESHLGRQYSDSPKYIYEEIVAGGGTSVSVPRARNRPAAKTPLVRAVWVYAKSRAGFPPEAKLVRRGSWSYYWHLARAQFWVDNQGFPREVSKRRGRSGRTTYIQTWHGTPLKKMGFDEPALEQAGEAERQAHRAMIDRWDHLLVPSEYFVETFVRSYRYNGSLLRCGLPRNDPLVRGLSEDERMVRLQALGLPTDRKLILYAPTFRGHDEHRKPLTELIDLRSMHRRLSEDYFLMVRAHYLDKLNVSRRYAAFARDLSAHHDITELLQLADVLVTDYSSVMFDYANLGRPMVFFAYDYDDYVRDERGTYLELTQVAPGPVVHDAPALIDALSAIDANKGDYAQRYDEFRARFCTYETGHAAATVVQQLFSEDPFRGAGSGG